MLNDYSFTCSCCGKIYEEIPLCFGNDYPDHYFTIPTDEIKDRVELTESLCIIDDDFFHRGRITIAIVDYHEDLIFNVWTSISKENFELRNQLWNDPNRIEQGPYFGWLNTIVPTYSNTLNIKTLAHEVGPGLIPNIEIIEENHSLMIDQQEGITFEKAKQKVQEILSDLHK
jgi:hypothetical protein